MNNKNAIIILTTNYFRNITNNYVLQYDNIIHLFKTIDETKNDIFIYCDLTQEELYDNEIKMKINNYFYAKNLNINICYFSFSDIIDNNEIVQKFKLDDIRYVGICNYVVFEFYKQFDNYDNYIFWEDDLLSTFSNFIYDDINNADIILLNEIEYDENWWWANQTDTRYLGIYDKYKGYHTLYCTYRFSNQVLNNIISIIENNKLYGHFEDVYSSIIMDFIDNKKYKIKYLSQIVGDSNCLISYDYDFIKEILIEHFDQIKNYNNMIIHPIKDDSVYLSILTNKKLL